MILYSKTLLSFLEILNTEVRKILTEEMGLRVNRTRFHWERHLIPFQVVLFEEKGKLGYFDSNFYRIGVHRDFLLRSLDQNQEEDLKNLLRHELAHFIQFLSYGNRLQVHGVEYRKICETYGWGSEVYKAKETLKPLFQEGPARKNQKIIDKVSKLLKLASSDNHHEAEAATLKANEILLKYNLSRLEIQHEDSEEVVLQKCLEFKRKSGKISAITKILETFFVDVVLNYGSEKAYMEIMGEKVNVEIATYVADFLSIELERVWLETKKENPAIKGQSQKNSFMKGVAKGFLEKQRTQRNRLEIDEKAMVRVHLALLKPAKNWFYRSLGSGSALREGSGESRLLGERKGRELSINPAIKSKGQSRMITYV